MDRFVKTACSLLESPRFNITKIAVVANSIVKALGLIAIAIQLPRPLSAEAV